MKAKRTVVTGGAGFIGSHIAEELAKENEVVIIDDFSTGKRGNIMSPGEGEGDVEVVEGSITDLALLERLFEGVDYVFHQAADPNVQGSIDDPLKTNEVNIKGTLNVLAAARANNVKKVVYAASSAVYGDTTVIPNVETLKPEPTSPYAITKLVGEYYCNIFYDVYGLPTTSLRYFNVYGPRQDPKSDYAAVIPRFISRILRNEPPMIYGDGEQTRDFIFVEDVVGANILAAEKKRANGEIINIGSAKRISINELAEKIMGQFEKNSRPIHIEPLPGDVRHSVADVEKAKELLGFVARYSLDVGLSKTINYFKGNRE